MARHPRDGEALDRFERQTAWPMLVLSIAIIPLLVIPLAVELSPTTETVIFAVDWIIWGLFAVEYGRDRVTGSIASLVLP
jgi:hypothetical protein